MAITSRWLVRRWSVKSTASSSTPAPPSRAPFAVVVLRSYLLPVSIARRTCPIRCVKGVSNNYGGLQWRSRLSSARLVFRKLSIFGGSSFSLDLGFGRSAEAADAPREIRRARVSSRRKLLCHTHSRASIRSSDCNSEKCARRFPECSSAHIRRQFRDARTFNG